MGQAILDLPDPTQLSGINTGPLSPEALASADDLLSQLAGDDIDRLLAEAEAERPLPPPPSASPPLAVAPPSPEPIIANLTSVTEASIAATSQAATEAAIDAILAPAIDSTLKAVDEQMAAAATPAGMAQAVEAAAMPQSVTQDAPPSAGFSAPEEKLVDAAAAQIAAIMDVPPAPADAAAIPPSAIADAAERQALSEPLIVPAPSASSSNRLWLLVKILEWINSPMLLFSDAAREAIGKVAILTTFNAAAVILYVMVFRRPHH
jgi:hypothetical protein